MTAATSRATAIAIAPGPHRMKLPKKRARSAENRSAGKNPAMKNTKA